MRPSNERHPGSERGLQRVCAPLRYVSSGAQIIANYRKLSEFQDQAGPSYVVPEFRVLAAENWPTLICPVPPLRSYSAEKRDLIRLNPRLKLSFFSVRAYSATAKCSSHSSYSADKRSYSAKKRSYSANCINTEIYIEICNE